MEQSELTQVARKRAEEIIDEALGALKKAAADIGTQAGIPENIAGHSVGELLGRMAYVPSMARELRVACGRELAKKELERVMSGDSQLPDAQQAPPPLPSPAEVRASPSTVHSSVPMGRDLMDISGVSVQTVKALKRANLFTVGDVMAVPDAHLLEINGIAEKSLANLREAIAKASTPATD